MRPVIRRGRARAEYHAGFVLLALSVLVLIAGCGKMLSAGETDREGAKAAVHGVASGVGERAEATIGASAEVKGTPTSGYTESADDADAPFVNDQRAGGETDATPTSSSPYASENTITTSGWSWISGWVPGRFVCYQSGPSNVLLERVCCG